MNLETKFYRFRQNNSYGRFDVIPDAGLSMVVYIEATSADHANALAEDKGIYFDGVINGQDCACCGDRWYKVDEHDGEDVPGIQLGYDFRSWLKDKTTPVFIHTIDGKIHRIEPDTKPLFRFE